MKHPDCSFYVSLALLVILGNKGITAEKGPHERFFHEINGIVRRRRSSGNSPSSSRTTAPITPVSSYSRFENARQSVLSPLPTVPYDPTLKPWRVAKPKSTTSGLKNRYSRKRTPILGGVLETVTSKIIASNAITFAGQVFNPAITKMGAKLSDVILSGRQLYRLITPVFLHGGVAHLAMNAYSLYNIGPQCEAVFGRPRFLAMYLASGVAGNALSALMSPNPSVGASGAIFGLIGGYYMFLKTNSAFFGRSGERGMSSVRSTLGMNLAFGLMNPVIDNWAHFGGALGGAAMAHLFGPRLYLMNVPGTIGTMVVDKPHVRLTSDISSIPGEIRTKFKRLKRKTRTDNYLVDISRPWNRLKNWR